MDLVPFRNQWAGSETKLDLKAWYRRPCPEHGGFSLIGPLPLRRHLDYLRKGYEYVTLATLEEVALVAPLLRAEGIDIEAIRKSYSPKQPYGFLIDRYVKDERMKEADSLADLQAKVDKFGVEQVTEIMRMQDPAFVMPESIQAPAKAKK